MGPVVCNRLKMMMICLTAGEVQAVELSDDQELTAVLLEG